MEDEWVPVEWPAILPRSLWEVAPDHGLRVRDRGDGPMISLAARSDGRSPISLRYRRLQGSVGTGPFALESLSGWDQLPFSDPAFVAFRNAEIERRIAAGGLAERISAFQLAFSSSERSELPHLVNDYLSNQLPELAGGTLYTVETARDLLGSIVAVTRMLVRAQEFPEAIKSANTNPEVLEGGIGLVSGDILGAASMLMPAVSVTSPLHLGTVAHRASGSVVILFPEPIRSPDNNCPASLSTLGHPSFFTSARMGNTIIGEVQPGDEAPFLEWWMDAWNRLLGQLLDPTKHRRGDGFFDPHLLLGRYLTVQRLLACVQAILVKTGLEEFARVELLFEALDLMENVGWRIGGWQELTTPNVVEQRLEQLRTELAGNGPVERAVLPRCERGVEALLSLRDGFRDMVTRNSDDTDRAVRGFLRALRNAGHGLNQSKDSREALVALMGHIGYVPPDLPDLVWFHLVRALCFGTWSTPPARTSPG